MTLLRQRGYEEPEATLDYPAKMRRWLETRDAFLEEDD